MTLGAPDQLRHRVAWVLASIFVVTEQDIDLDSVAEAWAIYYDIFVRHAFTSSFFDILKEVTFSPLMGQMLTFEGRKLCCLFSCTLVFRAHCIYYFFGLRFKVTCISGGEKWCISLPR